MAFHQMCTQHPVIISTLLEVERARKKKKRNDDYFILTTKTLHRGKMIHINLEVVRGSGGNSTAFEPGGKKIRILSSKEKYLPQCQRQLKVDMTSSSLSR